MTYRKLWTTSLPGFLLGGMLAATTGPGCRGDTVSFDCESQAANFLAESEATDTPLGEVPAAGPYPVAIFLTEEGLNELLASVIDEDVPFAGTVPFGFLPQGPGEAGFEATTPPRIILRKVEGCPSCVIFALDFGVRLEQQGNAVSSGSGYAELAVPLYFESDPAAGTTTLVADYSKAYIDEWALSVFGFDSDTSPILASALRRILDEDIQAENTPIPLLELGAWSLGQGQVQLLARSVFPQPELGRIVLAMSTNLPLPDEVGLDLNAQPRVDAKMTVQFDTRMMLTVAQRMMTEGEIARRYDADGEPDVNGIYGVTLTGISGSDSLLNTEMRLWRTAEGYCGFANLQLPLTLSVNEDQTGVAVVGGDALLLEGENVGLGVAAEEEASLVRDNQALVERFRADLADQVAAALNYEDLGVEGSRVLTRTTGVAVTPTSIDTYIEFLVVAEPD